MNSNLLKIKYSLRGLIKIKNKYGGFYLIKLIKELNKISFEKQFNLSRLNLNRENKKNLVLSIKQKINSNNKIFYNNFFISVGKSDKLTIPLPELWIKHLKIKNLNINYLSSRYLFLLFCMRSFLRSQFFILKNLIFNNFPIYKKCSVFLNLDHKKIGNNESINIIDQLIENNIISNDEKRIIHDNKFLFHKVKTNRYNITHSIFPKLYFHKRLLLFIYNISLYFKALLYIFINKFEYILLMEELLYFKYYSYLSSKKNNIKYFFHNTSLEYKPFWTYDHDKYSNNIFIYFYSSNMEDIQFSKDHISLPHTSLDLLHWKKYIVWDEFQKNYIEQFNKVESKYYIFGFINWLDSKPFTIPKKTKYSICVFDVFPMRISHHLKEGFCIPYYYSKKKYHDFYRDIEIATSNIKEITLLKKPKRSVNNKFISINFIENINNKYCKDYVSLDYDISINEIVKSCDLIICMPFTSPALIAKELGTKVIFYDPHGVISKTNHHQVKVIQTLNNLNNYLKKNLI